MSALIDMGLQGLGQATRMAWYFGLAQAVHWHTSRHSTGSADAAPAPQAPRRPFPSTREILTDLAQLAVRDTAAVRDGIYPPMPDGAGLLEQIMRARAMLSDFPNTLQRRSTHDASSVLPNAKNSDLPDYYVQDFHFQTGGYLTDHSARIYDVQVETLFLGGAGAMRREALRPIADFMRGRDQRTVSLLDVACGSGRFLHDCRIAWPAMRLTGLDLSSPYLDEARRHLRGLRSAEFVAGNAEHLPFADASRDIVTCIFLFHELPPDIRRRVAGEMARVLRPGGILVFIDSLQLGDRPSWDGLLEAFPARFHEPFYRHYLTDDLATAFGSQGLRLRSHWTSYLSKIVVFEKPEANDDER